MLTHAPIAQRIERYPPEVETRVRVAVGVLTETHPELQTTSVKQFLAMLRFEQRGKLEELPGELVKGVRDVCIKFP